MIAMLGNCHSDHANNFNLNMKIEHENLKSFYLRPPI